MKTLYPPHFGKNGGPSRYRYITLAAPMAAHDTLAARQRNLKLYYVLRWFLYTCTPGSGFFCIPTSSPALPHGGQCLRAHCAVSQETFLNSPAFQELLRMLKAEQLTPSLYLFDGYADGADKPMGTIDIIGYARRKKLLARDITVGRGLDRAHIPHFARQMLVHMKNKPMHEIKADEAAYREHFGL